MDFSKDQPIAIGLMERGIALLIDEVLIVIVSMALLWSLLETTSLDGIQLIFIYFLLHFLFTNAYFILVPFIWRGRTIGKRIIGLRITPVLDEKLSFQTMLIRGVILASLYSLIFPLFIASVVLAIVRGDHHTIHDLLTSTYVTYDRPQYH
ncbi:RDD family protein [Alkalibacillus aidingensis]|uniref:RDD family protein n=1 Tax=Alkalibacillus aidingensis TaxID=2747607 RepID=UPI0016610FDC|nr:RDD family protein [Alkalibacillus aidingensis]